MKRFSLLLKQQIRINTLENELATLKRQLQDGLYQDYLSFVKYTEDVEELKKENKRLRAKVKELKEMIK